MTALRGVVDKRHIPLPVKMSVLLIALVTVFLLSAAAPEGCANAHRPDTLVIAMTGDIMMGMTYPKVKLPEDGGAHLFDDVKPVLTAADLAIGNLEGTLCDEGTPRRKPSDSSYMFRTPTAYGRHLSDAGFDFLSMANNHAMDFGIDGVKSTETTLRERGIRFAGLKGRAEYAVVERKGVRFGICALGYNSYTLKHTRKSTIKEILNKLRQCSDIVIVSFHGGAEGNDQRHLPDGKEMFLNENRGCLREMAHFCVDNGADVVCGHGPHVLRCMEVYKDRFIAYSLGNFCTPYGINIRGVARYAPVLTIRVVGDGRFVDGRIHSFVQKRGTGPRADARHSAAREIRVLTSEDIKGSRLKIDATGNLSLK